MRYLKLKLVNYIGIYNGMGLNEIIIDFSKSINDIIMIKGPNGSGKSTIFDSLNPFPDGFNVLIPGLPAEKTITILDNNIEYFIRILYPINKKGERDTTKAYITKTDININESIELNPNGNIGSFKDIIFTELSLDPNYLALSYLSGTKRGLADMKPFERKKYTNAIIQELVDYNNIYKALSKKSSVYRGMINNIVSKIDNLGNKELLLNTQKSILNKIENYSKEKDYIIEEIAKCKATINLLDPTGKIYNEYNNMISMHNKKNHELTVLMDQKDEILSSIKIDDNKNIKNLHDIYTENYNNINNSIEILENNIQFILSDKESKAKKIQLLQSEIDAINIIDENQDLLTIKDKIKTLEIQINEYDLLLNNENNILSLNDCESALIMFENIKNDIYRIRDNHSFDIINLGEAVLMTQLYMNEDFTKNQINMLDNKISEYYRLLDISKPLELKPSECSNINCPFIENAVKAKYEIDNMNINNMINEKNNLCDIYNKDCNYNMIVNKINLYKNEIDVLYRYLYQNYIILKKCNINITKQDLCNYIKDGYLFDNEISILNHKREIANIKSLKDSAEESMNNLYNLYNKFKGKIDIINMNNKIIEELTGDLNELLSKIDSMNDDIFELQNKRTVIYDILQKIKYVLNIDSDISSLKNEIRDLTSRLNKISNDMENVKSNIKNSNELTEKLNKINSLLNPLFKSRDEVSRNINLCDEYNVELQKYKELFNDIEIFKKYSSPTKGIQLIFIELYMNNILTLANNMLSLLFDGQYSLTQFIINENEFRIPCLGSGIMNDDISSMSTSEICMISMILSFSILKQSSTSFNILKLDEIDGGLDENNRRIFVSLLYKIKSMLDVEQIFIISHNSEIPMDNVDLVLLNQNNLNESIYNSNIIFKN